MNDHYLKSTKRTTALPTALLVSTLGVVTLNIIFGLTTQQILIRTPLGQDQNVLGRLLYNAIGLTLTFGPIALLLFWYVRRFEGRPVRTLGFNDPTPVRTLARGAIIGVAMLLAFSLLLIATGQAQIVSALPEQRTLAAIFGALLALAATFVQASTEEIIFRGWLLPTLYTKCNLRVSILVSSLVFGSIHIFTHPSPLAILNLTLFGCSWRSMPF